MTLQDSLSFAVVPFPLNPWEPSASSYTSLFPLLLEIQPTEGRCPSRYLHQAMGQQGGI